ncbi:carboxymuconolactone decarboxylase family protein [Nocardiopsis sp. EMB25]|uniref:carboxymuconolactone decarboxylase family protein n=1 Tax=Nocardiopsis sp. EMB25 TaxID=2835867 RepID=UPI0022842310|nr:carboxymuconolactone decarboxylase family protein [Nocardiopsis sp. EMB25]MCY9782673.1 carboxymuconolactone decarboxylase family protein [Nocardiopsis sp. EMB25]
MLRTILRAAVRRSLNEVRHIRPDPPGRACGEVADLYGRVERDFGVLAPPVAMLSPAPECAAATWTALRESLLVPGRTGRAEREALATDVSRRNACPYCVEVHGATLGSLGGDAEPAGPSPRPPGSAPPAERAELGAVGLTFHYINRMVNVFLPDSPLPDLAPGPVRGPLRRATGAVIAAGHGPRLAPDTALELLPERARLAPAPDDLRWACGNPRILRVLTGVCAAVDAAGARTLPDTVRALTTRHIGEHGAEPAGVSRAWSTEPLAALPEAHRPLGRLALLTARASFQVGDDTVAECRRAGADDADLVRAVSWAAMTAARHATARDLTSAPRTAPNQGRQT